MTRLFGMITLLLATIVLVGCSGYSENRVIATVKFEDGTPLTSGQVRIVGDEFETFGYIQEDGTVDLGMIDGGVPDGVYQASIDAYAADPSGGVGRKSLVAKKFQSYETSGIQIEVSGDKEIEIVVEKP
ncbi:hypothetical protein [Blastopirellula marina]|nr:hypothetical protein [Blastopirellula marina]